MMVEQDTEHPLIAGNWLIAVALLLLVLSTLCISLFLTRTDQLRLAPPVPVTQPVIVAPNTVTPRPVMILPTPTSSRLPSPTKTVSPTPTIDPSITPSRTPRISPTPTPTTTSTRIFPTNRPQAECGPPFGWVLYSVQPGDTLYNLAVRTNAWVSDIQRANCNYSQIIRIGQSIYLPFRPALITSTPVPVTITPPPQRPTLTPTLTMNPPTNTIMPATNTPNTPVPNTNTPVPPPPPTNAPVPSPTTASSPTLSPATLFPPATNTSPAYIGD